MPAYVSVGVKDAQALPPGAWTTVSWNAEHADTGGQHPDAGGPSLLSGPAKFSLTASVLIKGLAPGTTVQARSIEVDAADAAKFEAGPVQDFVAGSDSLYVLYGLPAEYVSKGNRVRFQLVQHGAAAATLAAGTGKLLYWP